MSRNVIIFKVATWHYRCRHNLKNNCIWDNLQYCLLVPRSLSKPVMLTFDLQSGKVLFIEIAFLACITLKDNYDIGIYWRDIALTICPRSQPLLNMNIETNFDATLWRHRWCHYHKKTFFWHNLGRSFHIWGLIGVVFNISKFSKWPPFWARDKLFLPEFMPEVEYTRKIAMIISDILSFCSTL